MHNLLSDLRRLREEHPGWRLLCQHQAPFVLFVLHQIFIEETGHQIPESRFIAVVEDHLAIARESDEAPSGTGAACMGEWIKQRFIRRTLRSGDSEPVIDLLPEAHRAIEWIVGMRQRTAFVGTESRLRAIVGWLGEVRSGTEQDMQAHLDRLLKQRGEIENEIHRISRGEVTYRLSPVQVSERFHQIRAQARELLADLREVDQKFRQQDQELRSKIAGWEAPKGQLLSQVFGTHNQIQDSPQGRSFKAFWEYLLSSRRQEEFRILMDAAIAQGLLDQTGDQHLKGIEQEWLLAAEQAQNTLGRLSEQLRRFLDDRARTEHLRILRLAQSIETITRSVPEPVDFMFEIDLGEIDVCLPLERPLASTAEPVSWSTEAVEVGTSDHDAAALHQLAHVDLVQLRSHIDELCQHSPVVGLQQLVDAYPITQGLAEVIGYFQIAAESAFGALIDEQEHEVITWTSGDISRQAHIPRLIFWRPSP